MRTFVSPFQPADILMQNVVDVNFLKKEGNVISSIMGKS